MTVGRSVNISRHSVSGGTGFHGCVAISALSDESSSVPTCTPTKTNPALRISGTSVFNGTVTIADPVVGSGNLSITTQSGGTAQIALCSRPVLHFDGNGNLTVPFDVRMPNVVASNVTFTSLHVTSVSPQSARFESQSGTSSVDIRSFTSAVARVQLANLVSTWWLENTATGFLSVRQQNTTVAVLSSVEVVISPPVTLPQLNATENITTQALRVTTPSAQVSKFVSSSLSSTVAIQSGGLGRSAALQLSTGQGRTFELANGGDNVLRLTDNSSVVIMVAGGAVTATGPVMAASLTTSGSVMSTGLNVSTPAPLAVTMASISANISLNVQAAQSTRLLVRSGSGYPASVTLQSGPDGNAYTTHVDHTGLNIDNAGSVLIRLNRTGIDVATAFSADSASVRGQTVTQFLRVSTAALQAALIESTTANASLEISSGTDAPASLLLRSESGLGYRLVSDTNSRLVVMAGSTQAAMMSARYATFTGMLEAEHVKARLSLSGTAVRSESPGNQMSSFRSINGTATVTVESMTPIGANGESRIALVVNSVQYALAVSNGSLEIRAGPAAVARFTSTAVSLSGSFTTTGAVSSLSPVFAPSIVASSPATSQQSVFASSVANSTIAVVAAAGGTARLDLYTAGQSSNYTLAVASSTLTILENDAPMLHVRSGGLSVTGSLSAVAITSIGTVSASALNATALAGSAQRSIFSSSQQDALVSIHSGITKSAQLLLTDGAQSYSITHTGGTLRVNDTTGTVVSMASGNLSVQGAVSAALVRATGLVQSAALSVLAPASLNVMLAATSAPSTVTVQSGAPGLPAKVVLSSGPIASASVAYNGSTLAVNAGNSALLVQSTSATFSSAVQAVSLSASSAVHTPFLNVSSGSISTNAVIAAPAGNASLLISAKDSASISLMGGSGSVDTITSGPSGMSFRTSAGEGLRIAGPVLFVPGQLVASNFTGTVVSTRSLAVLSPGAVTASIGSTGSNASVAVTSATGADSALRLADQSGLSTVSVARNGVTGAFEIREGTSPSLIIRAGTVTVPGALSASTAMFQSATVSRGGTEQQGCCCPSNLITCVGVQEFLVRSNDSHSRIRVLAGNESTAELVLQTPTSVASVSLRPNATLAVRMNNTEVIRVSDLGVTVSGQLTASGVVSASGLSTGGLTAESLGSQLSSVSSSQSNATFVIHSARSSYSTLRLSDGKGRTGFLFC
jgi:hypothetical protein